MREHIYGGFECLKGHGSGMSCKKCEACREWVPYPYESNCSPRFSEKEIKERLSEEAGKVAKQPWPASPNLMIEVEVDE